MRITHIINPFHSPAGSPQAVVQAQTLQALERAAHQAQRDGIDVHLVAAVFPDEGEIVGRGARVVPRLRTNMTGIPGFEGGPMFPFLPEILDVGAGGEPGELAIFSNMDIIVQPYFYCVVAKIMQSSLLRHSYLIINRRTVSTPFVGGAVLSAVFEDAGKGHEGWDCFVFPRAWISRLQLPKVCVGVPFCDNCLAVELEVVSGFGGRVLRRQYLTVHMGDDKAWRSKTSYIKYNRDLFLSHVERIGGARRFPRGSVAELVYARAVARSDVPPRLIERILARLHWDDEARYLQWTMDERRRLGLSVFPDPGPGVLEYVARRLRVLNQTQSA